MTRKANYAAFVNANTPLAAVVKRVSRKAMDVKDNHHGVILLTLISNAA
jgi:hypothetical protein